MVAGWTIGARATRAVSHEVTRLIAVGLLVGVGLVGQAAPAEAVVGCSYEPESDVVRLTLQKRDGVMVGRDTGGNFVVAGVDCGPEATVQTVESVVIEANAVDNDTEAVTLDLSHGGFVDDVTDPAAPRDIDVWIDLGGRGTDSLVIEGANDIGDHVTVSGTSVELNGHSQVTTTGVERVEIRGNDGNDTIDATGSSFVPGQPGVLGASTANPGVTLVGGDGDDDLTGGEAGDMLVGNGGDDMLSGNGGNDWLDTGTGHGSREGLSLEGGAGSDTADFSGMFVPVEANLGEGVAAYGDGGSGLSDVENVAGTVFADLLVGDNADNTIDCAGGDDEAYGMAGKDRIRGAAGDDLLNGTGGGDSLDGGDGDDTLHGGGSGDGIGGGSGSDVIHSGGSGSGKDSVDSATGSDVIFGGPGRQVLLAGDGADEVYGEAGSDVVDGQDGEDMVFGGSGSDTVRGGDGPDQVYGGSGSNSAGGGAGDDEVYGGSGSNSGGSSSVDGGAGDDVLFGGGHMSGGIGDDVLNGGDSSDHLSGDDGDDVLNAGGGSDLLKGHTGDDVLRGAAGTDTVSFADSHFGVTASLAGGAASGEGEDALTGVENLWGSHLADSLAGDRLRNQLRGSGGADILAGGPGRDQESGEGGNDILNQGRNANGGDTLSGGAGRRDVVDYSARSHRVRITRDGSGNDGERGEHDNIRGDVNRVRH
jgi:Ca2+-binding RTX toxin-like protein